MEYLALSNHACEALLAAHAPCAEAVRASLLRLAWNILRASPAKRAEVCHSVWACKCAAGVRCVCACVCMCARGGPLNVPV